MTDVEELLRATLTDPRHQVEPVPGMYETVRGRARERRHRRFAIAAAGVAVVVIATVGSVIGVRTSSHHRVSPVTPPLPSSTPAHGTLSPAIDLGTSINVTGAVSIFNALYVLASDPTQVLLMSPDGAEIMASAQGPTGTPSGITVGSGGRVWAWSQDTGDVRVFDSKTLSFIAEFSVSEGIFNAVAVGNELYFTTDQGLRVAHTDVEKTGVMTTVETVTGIDGSTYGLAADPAQHRVLVGVTPTGSAPPNGFAGARVVAIDTRTGNVVAQSAQTSVGKESIAVVGDQAWIGGYGDVDKPRLLHLDAKTLKVVGSSSAGDEIGPGAIVWPGENVLWVRDGGSEGLSCVDPRDGAILEQWTGVQGPVTSAGDRAFGVQYGLQPLNLGGSCTG